MLLRNPGRLGAMVFGRTAQESIGLHEDTLWSGGPCELDPEESILTTRHIPAHPLQKAGHGELVQTPAGESLLAHLCSRPLASEGPLRRCPLGRETALQRVAWTADGWLRLSHGGVLPSLALPAPAGLVSWYDTRTHYYLRVSHDEKWGRIVGIILTDDGAYDEPADARLAINDWPAAIHLRAEIDHATLRFFASPNALVWHRIGGDYDASKLSDDYGAGLHFTGAFVGLAAHDVASQRAKADFDHFTLSHKPV